MPILGNHNSFICRAVMEELDFLSKYAGTLTIVIGGVAAVIAWIMSKTKVNLDAKTSMFEQQRLNMEQLLLQNRELASDLAVLRQRMAEMHEEQMQLLDEVRAMKSWYFMRVQFCKDCGLVDDAQKIFGEDRRANSPEKYVKNQG